VIVWRNKPLQTATPGLTLAGKRLVAL